MSIHHTSNTRDFHNFITKAQEVFKDRIYTDYLRRFAHGIDASCYRYIPKAVVRAINESDIQALFALSNQYNVPLTFRGAGTSLSGQACSDSILVLANSHFQDIEIKGDIENAESIKCGCAIIGVEANNALKPFGKKIGPDPATINNALIGGIFSNNSSGMCCGVKQNSYNTIQSIRMILHDGSILDTSSEAKEGEDIQSFLIHHKDKVDSLLGLRAQILSDCELQSLIKRKFSIKNTTGYSINALLDFSDIKDILNHIFIGAEGTLGFVSQVEYECVRDYEFKACALLFYKDLLDTSAAVQILAANEEYVSAAEIMDYGCLEAVSGLDGVNEIVHGVLEGACALLIQLEGDSKGELDSKIATISKALSPTPMLYPLTFSDDAEQMALWWKIRKGILPIAASTRPSGSVVITEDICYPIESFAKGMADMQELFVRFDFKGIIFGHALSGNVHFIITPNLGIEAEAARFGEFMEAMVTSVLERNGSTKAEHGTGRMVAPFVEREWGKTAYQINVAIKNIFDSKNLINPDVIISKDSKIHVKNLKSSHSIEDFMNQCMECGFCEKVCPSREITLTPRQRIAVYREISRLRAIDSKSREESWELEQLESGYRYFGVETCATCSMCSFACPLEIDTAKIALKLKPKMIEESPFGNIANSIAQGVANNMGFVLDMAKVGLKAAHVGFGLFGRESLSRLSFRANANFGTPYIPSTLPKANSYVLESKFVESSIVDSKNTPTCHSDISPRHSPSSFCHSTPSCHSERSESQSNHSQDNMSVCHSEALAEESQNAHPNTESIRAVIYFSTCINRTLNANEKSLQATFESLCKKAGIDIIYPKNLKNLCCGKAYKDYPNTSLNKAKQAYESLLLCAQEYSTKYGRNIPIVCDHSACSLELLNRTKEFESMLPLPHSTDSQVSKTHSNHNAPCHSENAAHNHSSSFCHSECSEETTRHANKDTHIDPKRKQILNICDMPQFIEQILPRLQITPLHEDIAIYRMCATKKGKWGQSLRNIAKACIQGEIIEHEKTQCCGFAGNKGFSCPTLNKSALREFQSFYANKSIKRGYLTSSTCEIGLNESTNISWQNLIYLVDEVSNH